jgi:hypothetical protein
MSKIIKGAKEENILPAEPIKEIPIALYIVL